MTTLPDQTSPDQTRDPIAREIDQTITAIREAVRIVQAGQVADADVYLLGARNHLTRLTETWTRWLYTLPTGTLFDRQAAICQLATSHAQKATALITRAADTDDERYRADCLIDARREIALADVCAADRERIVSFAKVGRAA